MSGSTATRTTRVIRPFLRGSIQPTPRPARVFPTFDPESPFNAPKASEPDAQKRAVRPQPDCAHIPAGALSPRKLHKVVDVAPAVEARKASASDDVKILARAKIPSEWADGPRQIIILQVVPPTPRPEGYQETTRSQLRKALYTPANSKLLHARYPGREQPSWKPSRPKRHEQAKQAPTAGAQSKPTMSSSRSTSSSSRSTSSSSKSAASSSRSTSSSSKSAASSSKSTSSSSEPTSNSVAAQHTEPAISMRKSSRRSSQPSTRRTDSAPSSHDTQPATTPSSQALAAAKVIPTPRRKDRSTRAPLPPKVAEPKPVEEAEEEDIFYDAETFTDEDLLPKQDVTELDSIPRETQGEHVAAPPSRNAGDTQTTKPQNSFKLMLIGFWPFGAPLPNVS